MRRIHVLPVIVIAAIALVLNAAAAFSDVTEELHKQVSLRPGTKVAVENISGKVDISTWNQPFVDILAVKRTAHDPETLKTVYIEVRMEDALEINTRYDNSRERSSFFSRLFGLRMGSWYPSVDYTIRIPRSAVLSRVKTTSGDIIVRDIRGDALLHSVSGQIKAINIEGMLDIKSTSGDIYVERSGVRNVKAVSGDIFLRDAYGDVFLNTVSGNIRAEGANGMATAKTISGNLFLSGFSLGGASSTSGTIRLSPAGFADNVHLKSISGDIRLCIPQRTNAEIYVKTSSGNFISRTPERIMLSRISRNAFSGRIGTGGKQLSVNTTSGDIVFE